MTNLELPALAGTNPLGFLAALGVLDVLERNGRAPTMYWTDDLVPAPVVTGAADVDDLIALLDADRAGWRTGVVLNWPSDSPLRDIKPDPETLGRWARDVAEADRAQGDLWTALLAEGGYDNNGKAKPTHLHFTAGQQRFLVMVRELVEQVEEGRFREAVVGPWRYDSELPSLSWDARGERIYALRGPNPAKEKRSGVPGADWLAFLGLSFYPVAVSNGRLITTGCDTAWKRSAFRWPLWSLPCSRMVVTSLVAHPEVVGQSARSALDPRRLRARGILRVLQSSIRRSEQGGYGSFGAPDVLVEIIPSG